ncbi:hypothetical protein HMPREF9104_00961 [Lentilactobacillus kisonensis F0435]|uniref:Uncharacterized protein n=1 Tax=Lentilactobacillus kisonensis F0435 TaxID=797516 RepID=H1LED5_9LACO|nr:hypothetical protein HMPREF9104_00961 [Lentilactobacillus kisonensis F0435]
MRISSSSEKTFLEKVFAADGFSEHDGSLLADTLSMPTYEVSHHMAFNDLPGIPA